MIIKKLFYFRFCDHKNSYLFKIKNLKILYRGRANPIWIFESRGVLSTHIFLQTTNCYLILSSLFPKKYCIFVLLSLHTKRWILHLENTATNFEHLQFSILCIIYHELYIIQLQPYVKAKLFHKFTISFNSDHVSKLSSFTSCHALWFD